MSLEDRTCFKCGKYGHIQADCPYSEINGDGTKPPWCGICDPRTRLVGLGPDGPLARCSTCHPLRGQLLKGHKRCSGCRTITTEWDTNPCGQHSIPLGIPRRPDREHIDAIIAREAVRE